MLRKVSLLTLAVATLAACQAPPGAVGAAQTPLLAGRVEFPGYTLQAASSDVLQNAVVSLTDATGATVAAGVTDAAGHFSLYRSTQPFAPTEGQGFVLSVAKRVGGLDRPVLTLRTEVVRRADGWDSITGEAIVINLLTSAVTKLDEQDADVTFETVMGKVVAGEPLAFGRYSPGDVTAARAALQASLTANADPAGAWLFEGDYEITDQASMEALQRYDGVTGSLTIASSCPLTELDLPNLRHVGNGLTIQGNPALENLDGLGALVEAGWVSIGSCTQLTSIEGLAKLAKTRYGVTVSNNPLLTSLAGLDGLVAVGSLEIAGNPLLTDTAHLGRLRSITSNGLVVRDNPAITAFGPLPRLETVASAISIEGNDELVAIGAMPALRRVGMDFTIAANAKLTGLGTYGPLDVQGEFVIESNDALANLDGLEGITRMSGGITLADNPALTSLSGLRNLTWLGPDVITSPTYDEGDFYIANNDALVSLAGLENLAVVKGASIINNDRLTSLSALASLSRVRGDCLVMGNPALVIDNCLQPLPQATIEVTGNVWIYNNDPESCAQ